MSLLRQLYVRKVVPGQSGLFLAVSRQASGYLSDHFPGPRPKTEKERLEAAKKYGLLPEEYKPIDSEIIQLGDYPQLPDVGADSRDPFYPWDYPDTRRNYGEAMHHDFEFLTQGWDDPARVYRVPKWKMLAYLFGTMGTIATLAWGFEQYRFHHPVCVKQFPNQGKVHYGF